jgi:hypothetical protein
MAADDVSPQAGQTANTPYDEADVAGGLGYATTREQQRDAKGSRTALHAG